MAVYLSPVGLSAAQVPNRVSLLATYKERLCRRICENSTNQPEAFVTNVVLSAEGQTQRLANVSCGSSNCLAIYSSLTVSITPAAAPAA